MVSATLPVRSEILGAFLVLIPQTVTVWTGYAGGYIDGCSLLSLSLCCTSLPRHFWHSRFSAH